MTPFFLRLRPVVFVALLGGGRISNGRNACIRIAFLGSRSRTRPSSRNIGSLGSNAWAGADCTLVAATAEAVTAATPPPGWLPPPDATPTATPSTYRHILRLSMPTAQCITNHIGWASLKYLFLLGWEVRNHTWMRRYLIWHVDAKGLHLHYWVKLRNRHGRARDYRMGGPPRMQNKSISITSG